KHSFPMNHGQKKHGGANACTTCHKRDDGFRTYTCYGCHKHDPDRIAKKHRKFVAFDNCVACHADGRKTKKKPRKTAQTPTGASALLFSNAAQAFEDYFAMGPCPGARCPPAC